MRGTIIESVALDKKITHKKARKDFTHGINDTSEIVDIWTNALSFGRTRPRGDLSLFGDAGATGTNDSISNATSESDRTRSSQRNGTNYQNDLEESMQLIKELRKLYGTDNSNIKHSHKPSPDSDTVTVSRGQLAKLKANYDGEKQFNKKDITTALGKEIEIVIPEI